MSIKVLSFVVLLFLSIGTPAFAQPPGMAVRFYTMKDGLPEPAIHKVIQDKHGFLWMASQSGLIKFDGVEFTMFRNDPVNKNSLSNNFTYHALEDKRGRLWIAHSEGTDLFDPNTEDFDLSWREAGKKLTGTGVKFLQKKDGKIWACSASGMFTVDPKTFDVKPFLALPSVSFIDVLELNNGSVLALAPDSGLYLLDETKNELKLFQHDPHKAGTIGELNYWSTIMIDSRHQVWITTVNGLELFDPVTRTFNRYPTKFDAFKMLEDRAGRFWVGCSDGLYLFDKQTGGMKKVSGDECVLSIMQDKEGSVWISTYSGLEQYYDEHKNFLILSQFGNSIGPIIEHENKIWISGAHGASDKQRNGHVYQFDPLTGSVQPCKGSASENLNYYVVENFFVDRHEQLRLISKGKLGTYNYETEAFESIPIGGKIDPLSNLLDTHGTLWTGDWSGLYYLDSTLTQRKIDSLSGTVYCILQDSAGNIWAGTDVGLFRYNLLSHKVDVYNSTSANTHNISNNIVYYLMMDKNGTIWIGTGGGLNMMVKGTEGSEPQFKHWRNISSNLLTEDVYCLVEGSDGTLWMSYVNTITNFDPRTQIFRNYDAKDGLSGAVFRSMAYLNGKGIRSADGRIYFGSTNGLVVFHPDSLTVNTFIPPVLVTDFYLRSSVARRKGYSTGLLNIENDATALKYEPIRLSHDQNDFTISFAALNYIDPERNKFRYKLEPYEKNWIDVTPGEREAHYTNLSPGTYQFRLIGSNNDDIWNEKGVTLTVIIASPWWQTWWASGCYIAIAIMALLLWRGYDYRRLKLKHRAQYLAELDKTKTSFFTNISHEFRTPLTLLIAPLRELYAKARSESEKSQFSSMIRNGDRLLRLTNQLLDLSKLDFGKFELHAEPVELISWIKEITAAYDSVAKEKGIRYAFHTEIPYLIVSLDQEKAEKVFHNLLSNAFKFTKAGQVSVSIGVEDKQWATIRITDTGIGIPGNELDKVFDRFYQVEHSQTRRYEGSGLGMALAKEIVELHNGRILLKSKEGEGTTFTVFFALSIAHLAKDHDIVKGLFQQQQTSELLPADEMSPEIGSEADIPYLSDTPTVILIVEDNDDMREYIKNTLSREYHVIEAADGQTGLALAESALPDLIISDVMMPGMDGNTLCRAIRSKELTSHIAFILLTAKADRDSKLTGLLTGADDYLSKPFDGYELKLIIRNRLESRRKLKARFATEVTLEPRHIAITSFDERFIKKVLDIIEDHMNDELFSIERLSREVGYSSMHLYRKIKALTDQTPSQFVRTIRLKRAAELLANNSDNVTQIAYSVGFSSVSYFNKCFKEQFGVSPGKFLQEKTSPLKGN